MQQLWPPLFGEHVDNPVQRLIGIGGMQRRQHQMPGVSKRQGMLHGFAVADFADQHHIRGLAQGIFQCRVKAAGINADFTLIDDRALVSMDVLDRVFDRDDVPGTMAVAMVDKRGQRGRFA